MIALRFGLHGAWLLGARDSWVRYGCIAVVRIGLTWESTDADRVHLLADAVMCYGAICMLLAPVRMQLQCWAGIANMRCSLRSTCYMDPQ